MTETASTKGVSAGINGRLARRMSMYVILASTLIAVFTSGIQIYAEFQRDVNGVYAGLEQIKRTHLSNIASRIWVLDTEELHTTLRSLLSLPAIHYVAAYNNKTLFLDVGENTDDKVITRVYPLYYSQQGSRIRIGKLVIKASLENAYRRIIERALIILAGNAVKTFIVAALILLIFYRLVARHLNRIAEFAGTLEIDTLDSRFEFDRRQNPADQQDELDLLRTALTTMQRNLAQATQELKDSRNQVSLLLNSTAEAIYGIDLEGRCTFVNQACLDILGYQHTDELLGREAHRIIHHSHEDGSPYPWAQHPIHRALCRRQRVHVTDEVLWRKDGSHFAAEYWSHPIFKHNEHVGAVVTFLETTERAETLKALQQRELDLAITLNSIGDAVITTDLSGRITRMNPMAEKLTGWTFAEAQHQPIQKVFQVIDATTGEHIDNPIGQVIHEAKVVHLSQHATLISRHGERYQITDTAAPIRYDDDAILGMVLVFNDITEQYQLRQAAAENKRVLQAIMDHSPAVIYAKSPAGRFVFVNRRFEKLFKLRSEEVIGKTLHDLFPQQIAEQMIQNDLAVLQAGHTLEFEEVAPHEDGPHTYASIKFPLFDDSGEISAVCGISTDITRHKQQEEQLRRSQKMDALGKLTGGIAHDFNNILGIMLGYANLLRDLLDGQPKLAAYVAEIQHAGERGAALTQKLLGFSRRKSNDSTLVQINTLLQDQQLMLEKILTARIRLNYRLADSLWPVELDVGDLEDAIVNLCINAMHAMQSEGELTLATANRTITPVQAQLLQLKAGDYVVLDVIDTGCGIDYTIREKIFDPFFSTKGNQGTGLGLSQVYGFVQRSNGAIKLYSEPGRGTRFSLYFPRARDEERKKPPPRSSKTQPVHGSETLLVVDDEPAIVKLAESILSRHGYRVLTAADGEQALSVLENDKVDLTITDIIMPKLDGNQLAREIARRFPETRVLVVSGYTRTQEHDNGLPPHHDLLYKPYTAEELLNRVRRSLDRPRERSGLEGLRVLIIDDDRNICRLFALNLEKLGCTSIVTNDAAEGLKHYQQSLQQGKPVDIVIVDLNIPGSLNGKQIAQRIRALDPDARIIVSSGDSHSSEMTDCGSHGFDAAIEKNFNRNEIRKVLAGLLKTG